MLIFLSGRLERGRLSRYLEFLRRFFGRSRIENLILEGVRGFYRRGVGRVCRVGKRVGVEV